MWLAPRTPCRCALGVQSEHADGHVPELHRDGHVVDRRGLLAGELTRNGARATAAVVEAASLIESKPSAVAGRGEAKHSQCDRDGDALLCSFDGAQDGGFGFAGRHPLGVEPEAEQANQEEKEAGDGQQELDSALELQDPGAKLLFVLGEQLRRDHRPGAAANPACSGGARDAQLGEESGIALLADQAADAVVVGSVEGVVRH